MSYILDALRKSEQDRQRGRVPDLNSFKDEAAAAEPARNFWPWVTAGVVVINLVVVVVIWAPWRSEHPVLPQPTATLVPAPVQAPAVAVVPVQSAQQPAPTVQTQPQPVVSPTPVAPQMVLPAAVTPPPQPQSWPQPRTDVVDNRPAIQATPTQVSPEYEEPVQEPFYPAAAPNVAYMPQLEELSPSDRAGIPDMTFSSHMYSSMPRFRSIIINGKRLKEGEYFTQDLQVREITDKGVIMSNGNVLFTVDVLGRWAQ